MLANVVTRPVKHIKKLDFLYENRKNMIFFKFFELKKSRFSTNQSRPFRMIIYFAGRVSGTS